MSVNDGDLVDRLAKKHSISPAAVQVVLAALRSGGGRMAQFSHADFGGMSQWSLGTSMVEATCSICNSRPSWTRCVRISPPIWIRRKRPARRVLLRTRLATGRRNAMPTGGPLE
jgi:hypothetical protein